jgi:alpha-beta hydrolase superfamily lysophospholipase
MASSYKSNLNIEYNVNEFKEELTSLDFKKEPKHTPSTIAYFQYYNINFGVVEHYFGTFQSNTNYLFSNIYKPRNPKGTIFLIHGYNDHSGLMSNLVGNFLNRGFAVALFDLPGHGLSSGERSSIHDFSDYVLVLKDFIKICELNLPKPYYLVGHSLGCSIILEYLLSSDNKIFDKIVFLAPLIHSAFWKLSKIAYFSAKPLINSIPRKSRQDSSDLSFVEFSKKDPLQGRRIPLKWMTAFFQWNLRIEDCMKISKPIFVIQGKKDTVVDWEYNLSFLKKKFDVITILLVEKAGHQLHNEKQDLRVEVFNYINQYIP